MWFIISKRMEKVRDWQQRKVKLRFIKGNSGFLFRFAISSMLDGELFSWQDDHIAFIRMFLVDTPL